MINIQKLRKRIQNHDDAEIMEEDSKSVVSESIKKNEIPVSNKENPSVVNESDDGEYADKEKPARNI